MVTLYAVLIGSIVGCLFYARKYKKEERMNYRKKTSFGDGFGLFLYDIFLVKQEKNNIFKRIYPNKDFNIEQRMFRMRQIASSIFLLLIFLILGLFQSLSAITKEEKEIVSIERPLQYEGEKNVSLEVEYEDQRDVITIPVEAYRFTESEIKEQMEYCYEELYRQILGENESFERITTDFDFSVEEWNGITVQYVPFEDGWILTDGSLNWEKIYEDYIFKDSKKENNEDKQKINSGFVIMMNSGEIYQEYKVEVVIQISEEKKDFEEQLLYEIKSNNSVNQKNLKLPEMVEDKTITFYEQREKASIFYLVLGLVAVIMGIFSKNEELNSKLIKRNKQLAQDYASIVNKLMLLTGAGMTLLGAWDRIIIDYENNQKQYGFRYVYEEMKLTRKRMQNGISEAEAYSEFGRRCDNTVYIKLGCLLEQNIRKGTKGLNDCLNQEVREAFAGRKALAKKRGEETATKLLLPMTMMLVISMVIVVVPAFLTMGM